MALALNPRGTQNNTSYFHQSAIATLRRANAYTALFLNAIYHQNPHSQVRARGVAIAT
jgi:hypothetical protein